MLSRQTRRLYYEDPYRISSGATVVRVGADYLELDQTVAFPEGGGQEACFHVAMKRCKHLPDSHKVLTVVYDHGLWYLNSIFGDKSVC